jgi:hypothetical protein
MAFHSLNAAVVSATIGGGALAAFSWKRKSSVTDRDGPSRALIFRTHVGINILGSNRAWILKVRVAPEYSELWSGLNT